MREYKLTPRERKFATLYLQNGGNAVQAAFGAGYVYGTKYGYFTAAVQANRMLKKPKIARLIDKAMKSSKLSADQVIEKLSEVADSDVKIEGAQKVKALELLGKHHKLFDRAGEEPPKQNSLESAQKLYAEQYQNLTHCSESEAKLAAEAAFQFTQTIDHSEKQAS